LLLYFRVALAGGLFSGLPGSKELGLMWPQINTCSVLKSCFNCLGCCTLEELFFMARWGVKRSVKSSSQGWY